MNYIIGGDISDKDCPKCGESLYGKSMVRVMFLNMDYFVKIITIARGTK